MKTVAVMQPYLFPYIGYFHLIKAVDVFVLYDDVNFIRQGWINRNNILLDNKKHLWTLPLKDASSFRLINDHFLHDAENSKNKFLTVLQQAYKKAPYFTQVFPEIEKIMKGNENNISYLIKRSLEVLSSYMGIKTKFIFSSDIDKDNTLPAQDRVIDIVKALDGKRYVNAIGGQELYSKEDFRKKGLELVFVQSGDIVYKQFNKEFIPYLSVIDVLMFNDQDAIKKHLNNYSLI